MKSSNIIKKHKLLRITNEECIEKRNKLQGLILEGKTYSEIARELEIFGKENYLAFELGWIMAINHIWKVTNDQMKDLLF